MANASIESQIHPLAQCLKPLCHFTGGVLSPTAFVLMLRHLGSCSFFPIAAYQANQSANGSHLLIVLPLDSDKKHVVHLLGMIIIAGLGFKMPGMIRFELPVAKNKQPKKTPVNCILFFNNFGLFMSTNF